MNTGAHDAGGGFTQSAGTNAARGVGVILAAVAVGFVLMWIGYSSDTVIADAGNDDSALVAESDDDAVVEESADGTTNADGSSTADSTTTTTAAPTTTTTEPAPAARPAAEVTAVVLNAADGKPGIAGATSKIIEQAGYETITPRDAGKDQATSIQYVEGYEGDAIAMAGVFGLDASVVEALPAEPNIRAASHIAGAQVVVFVGFDDKIDPPR